jgi:hypothetical protein
MGRKALRLSGQSACLALIPGLELAHGRLAVDIGTEGTAYAGIIFRASDTHNYELAYAQPHTSGKWDALQYDPVFHGSNTWQLYHGPGAQLMTEVPQMSWFRLGIEFKDRQAVIRIGEQAPLCVHRLAHDQPDGMVGLWTYRPAYFCNWQVWDDLPDWSSPSIPAPHEPPALGVLTEWFLEGYGKVICEPGGILNLNRYLPVSVDQVRLVRWLELAQEAELTFTLGFSDELILQVDEQDIFSGQNIFHPSPEWSKRGYVCLDHRVRHRLTSGLHKITADLKATEYFGFGMVLGIEGEEFSLLPARLCG